MGAHIKIIAAMAKNRAIGKDNKLLWHLPKDMEMFKMLTNGRYVIMGRKTFESIGRPLPNRKNVVITSQKEGDEDGVRYCKSLDEAILYCRVHSLLKAQENADICIIGGGQVYEEAISRMIASHIWLSIVDVELEGDTYFPEINTSLEHGYGWAEVARKHFEADEKNKYAFDLVCYQRFQEWG